MLDTISRGSLLHSTLIRLFFTLFFDPNNMVLVLLTLINISLLCIQSVMKLKWMVIIFATLKSVGISPVFLEQLNI